MARVVIVDDNEHVRELLRVFLTHGEGGHEIVGEASNGEEGIDVVAALTPDAVILDWQMPLLDGFGALPRIRAAVPDAVIVMFSSRGSYGAPDAIEAGADAYVGKEEGPGRVIEEINERLGVTG